MNLKDYDRMNVNCRMKEIDFKHYKNNDTCIHEDCHNEVSHYLNLNLNGIRVYIGFCEKHQRKIDLTDEGFLFNFHEVECLLHDEICCEEHCGEKPTHVITTDVAGHEIKVNLCKRHAYQILSQHNGKKLPVFLCEEINDGSQMKFFCPYCLKYHIHGKGEGHRVAHCFDESPLKKGGYYIIKEMEED